MIEISFDKNKTFFKYQGKLCGSINYLGNDSFYFKYKSTDGERTDTYNCKTWKEAIELMLTFLIDNNKELGDAALATLLLLCW